MMQNLRGRKEKVAGEKYIMWSFIICNLPQILLQLLNMKEVDMGGTCSTHERNEKCKKSRSENLNGREPCGRRRLRWNDNIKMDLTEISV
jgi:hypothetical protein